MASNIIVKNVEKHYLITWSQNNRERSKQRRKNWASKNKDKILIIQRKVRYKLTEEVFNYMLNAQNNNLFF